jgi:hypothetical protein
VENIGLREQILNVLKSTTDVDLSREIYKLMEPDEPAAKPRLVEDITHWLTNSRPKEIDFGQMKREVGIKAIKGRALGEEVVEALDYLIERKCVLK